MADNPINFGDEEIKHLQGSSFLSYLQSENWWCKRKYAIMSKFVPEL